MTEKIHQWYKDYIEKEIDFAENCNFTGKLTFEVNFKTGHIGNINITTGLSVKKEVANDQFSKAV